MHFFGTSKPILIKTNCDKIPEYNKKRTEIIL